MEVCTTKVVYQVVSTNFAPIVAITSDRTREYAAKCGAEYHLIEVPTFEEAVHHKIRAAAQMLAVYDSALYVDADVVIARDAPNIFERQRAGLGALDEGRVFPDRITHVATTHGVQLDRYFNAGVMLLDRSCIPAFRQPIDIELSPPWYEQCGLNIAAKDIPFYDLGVEFNCMPSTPCDKPYFRHAAGLRGSARMEALKKWMKM